MPITDTLSDIVIFGAMGDLAQRKLIPALYQLEREGLLHPDTRILGAAREDADHASFAEQCRKSLQRFVPESELSEKHMDALTARLGYCVISFTEPDQYLSLYKLLNANPDRTRIYYYATPASMYGPISQNLQLSGCLNEQCRVVLEKPIGHNHQSSSQINDQVAGYFSESQIYRIDHYLGKETVQNLIALRFANPLFGAVWDHNHISHVEITVAEKIGIEGRWGYFDQAGQMRDMVQNHLLQLLCLTAMAPPDDLSADSIRDEKVKVLKALRPVTSEMQKTHAVRGRYTQGTVDEKAVPGYMEEEGANPESNTETFVSIKAEIENWCWAGVPFYLRTGKRMPEKLSQIVIHFKPQPHFIFDESQKDLARNKLVIRLQPEEGISLQILSKDQGISKGMHLRSAPLQLDFAEAFSQPRTPDAYERLLLEITRGNQYLFVRRDEVEHSWNWCDQILELWKNDTNPPEPYSAGSWGPDASKQLTAQDGNNWHED